MTFSRKAHAAAARLKALPSGAMLPNRVSIWIRPPTYLIWSEITRQAYGEAALGAPRSSRIRR